MLVLCETRLVSLYIGERIITSAEGAETLATSNSVIGGYNVAETVYKFGGCIHPESIVVVGGHAVVMGPDHYDSLMETLYLLSSPNNTTRLNESIAQLRAGKTKQRELIKDDES